MTEKLPSLLEMVNSYRDIKLDAPTFEYIVRRVAATPESPMRAGWGNLIAPAAPKKLLELLEKTAIEYGKTSPSKGSILQLQNELKRQQLNGFIVPRSDTHMGEYIPAAAERLAWLTGFTGSAGTAFIMQDAAWLFVDGRYTLQAPQQVDISLLEVRHFMHPPLMDFIISQVKPGDKIGYDPKVHTRQWAEALRKKLEYKNAILWAVKNNPVDTLWHDQPPPPFAPIRIHPINYAGEDTSEKIRKICKKIKEAKAEAVVINQLDSLAWILNLRGGDLPHTPLFQGFAIIRADESSQQPVQFFVDPAKLAKEAHAALNGKVALYSIADFEQHLIKLGKTKANVLLDLSQISDDIVTCLENSGAVPVHGTDPASLLKAQKNPTEIKGMQTAHIRDAVALCEFLCWLDEHVDQETVTELGAINRLETFRRKNETYQGPSFDTIAGAGANGAIVHYRADETSNQPLEQGTLFLLDSGGQYPDGTTDITRTIAIGTPTDEMRQHFTLVLKGHIRLSRAIFPKGTRGAQLDILAREALWQTGLDFDHGTGHGVGCFLNVHEGPQNISSISMQALLPGMIVSNEPGFYKKGAYGIRIENLLLVHSKNFAPQDNMDKEFLGFETLTFVPIDKRLIIPSLLDNLEKDWLNTYHKTVYEKLHNKVNAVTLNWLKMAVAPI